MGARAWLLAALLALAPLTPARAASVYVTAASEEFGHAWLFGSRNRQSERCWLALPRHVVEAFGTEELLPVRFKGRTGDWGETAVPVAVSAVPGAAEAAGTDDLAFAEVLAGPRLSQCLDRLGPMTLAFEAALERRDPMFVRSMLPQSFGDFEVRLDGGTSGERSGLLRLTPTTPADAGRYFKRGLSGAVATITRPSGAEPFAMILRVEDSQASALALRFDRIRAAFDLVEAAILGQRREQEAEANGVPFDIVGFSGMAAGSGPAAAFAAENGCWTVAPEGGKRQVQIVVDIAAAGTVLRGLTMAQAPGCGEGPLDISIDQRRGTDGSWSRTAQCRTAPSIEAVPACRLDLRAPRQLRIGITAAGEIGLSGLRLY